MEENINKKMAQMLQKIISSYNSLNEFSQKADISSAYISKLINLKYKNPPSPNILKKISNASKGITTYDELMKICGYFTGKINNSLLDSMHYVPIPVFSDIEEIEDYKILLHECDDENTLIDSFNHIYFKIKLKDNKFNFFAYKTSDDSMLPLLGTGDIAIIEKNNTYENGQTCLISLEDKEILIRKILDFKDYIELHTVIPYNQPIKLTKEEMKDRNFTILGRVIKVENESSFK